MANAMASGDAYDKDELAYLEEHFRQKHAERSDLPPEMQKLQRNFAGLTQNAFARKLATRAAKSSTGRGSSSLRTVYSSDSDSSDESRHKRGKRGKRGGGRGGKGGKRAASGRRVHRLLTTRESRFKASRRRRAQQKRTSWRGRSLGCWATVRWSKLRTMLERMYARPF